MSIECPSCESLSVTFEIREEILNYPKRDMKIKVPTGVCSVCDFTFTDSRAEAIRLQAHKEYFKNENKN